MATQSDEIESREMMEESPDSCVEWKISHFLTTTFHMVINMLMYLNARELNSCARVCKFWAAAVKTLKSRRRTKAWTFLNGVEDDDESRDQIYHDTADFVHGLYTEPKVLFMFCNTDFTEEALTFKSNTYKTYGDFVHSLLPRDCQLIAISTPGVVGSNLGGTFECENNPAVSFLCLPKYDGVSVMEYRIDESEDALETTNINHLHNTVEDYTACKAVLNLIVEPDVPRSFVFDLRKDFETAVLAGGMVDSLVPLESDDSYHAAMQVALCGRNVDVGCVVIRENVHTMDKAEEKIKELKNYKLSERNSFAFMFACVGRGEGLWGEKHVESTLFRKHFPNTPLLGFFGNGEIGMDHVTTTPQKQEDSGEPFCKKVKRNQKLFHSFTTIMVLVSIKHHSEVICQRNS